MRARVLAFALLALAWGFIGSLALLFPGIFRIYRLPLGIGILTTALVLLYRRVPTVRTGESALASSVWALLALLLLTGAGLELVPLASDARRSLLLTHILAGVAAFLPVTLYLLVHVGEALRRKPWRLLGNGTIAGVSLIVCVWTGVFIALGQTREMNVLATPHRWSALVALLVGLVHVRLGLAVRVTSAGLAVPAEDRLVRRVVAGVALGSPLVVIAFVSWWHLHGLVPREESEVPLEPLPETLAQYSNAGTASGRMLSPADANWHPDTCGGTNECHVDTLAQWSRSAHARSGNPAYLMVVTRLEADQPRGRLFCAGCHEPRRLLTPLGLPIGFGAVAPEDGVTCQVCHGSELRDDVRGSGALLRTPAPTWFLRTSRIPFWGRPMIDVDLAVHRENFRPAVLADPRFCSSCHTTVVPGSVHVSGAATTITDKYGSWASGRYAVRGEDHRSCTDCHMPDAFGPVEPFHVKSHAFPSSNTGLPWLAGDAEKLAENVAFLTTGKIALSGVCGDPSDADTNTGAAAPSWRCAVTVTNAGVGHEFPSGPRDLVEVWLDAQLVDSTGMVLWQVGQLDRDGRVIDPPLTFRETMVGVDGEPLLAHEFWKAVRSDGRPPIPPGGRDEVSLVVPIPARRIDGDPHLVLRVRHRRYNEVFARLLRPGTADLPPITEIASLTLGLKQPARLGPGPV